jgi:hypothetical protein
MGCIAVNCRGGAHTVAVKVYCRATGETDFNLP